MNIIEADLTTLFLIEITEIEIDHRLPISLQGPCRSSIGGMNQVRLKGSHKKEPSPFVRG